MRKNKEVIELYFHVSYYGTPCIDTYKSKNSLLHGTCRNRSSENVIFSNSILLSADMNSAFKYNDHHNGKHWTFLVILFCFHCTCIENEKCIVPKECQMDPLVVSCRWRTKISRRHQKMAILTISRCICWSKSFVH